MRDLILAWREEANARDADDDDVRAGVLRRCAVELEAHDHDVNHGAAWVPGCPKCAAEIADERAQIKGQIGWDQ
jgi:hypothetical protein